MANNLSLLGAGTSSGGASSAPSSPVAGYTLWYDASQESYANNDAVGTMTDRSANGFNATQLTGFLQPLFKKDILNNKPGYLFDGVDDYLETSAILSSIISASAYTVFAVFKPTAIGSDIASTWQNDSILADLSAYFGICLKQTGPTVYAYNWDSNDDHVGKTISTGNPFIVSTRHESGNLYCSINGGSDSSTASGNTGALGGVLDIGTGSPPGVHSLNGYIFEIIIYNTALSAGNIALNYSYLNNKYAVY